MHSGLHHAEGKAKEGSADLFDRLMIVVGVLGPISLFPQVLKIWTDRNAENISLISWVMLSVISTLWTIYGIRHRSSALIVTNVLFTILNLLVVAAFFLFR
jgi:uncharacterized protein with PQ loop repeat